MEEKRRILEEEKKNDYTKFPDDIFPYIFYCSGYKCAIVRNPPYCGYVYFKTDSPLKNRDFESEETNVFDIHGGITYQDHEKIGFDFGHFGDYMEGSGLLFEKWYSRYKYWSFNDVTEEVKKLVNQVKDFDEYEMV